MDWNKGSATSVWLEKWASDRAVGEQDVLSSARVRERREGSLKISRVDHIAEGTRFVFALFKSGQQVFPLGN